MVEGAASDLAADYPRRRPLLYLGRLRRLRSIPDGSEDPTWQRGDRLESGTVVARALRAGRATAVDLAAALGVAPDEVSRYLLAAVDDDVVEGEVIAERRAFGGFQRRTVRAPLTGRLGHVSASGTAYIMPGAVTVEVTAHLGGVVAEVLPNAIVVEGRALAVAARAGAGPAVAGPLLLAQRPDSIPADVAGGVVVCGFPLDEGAARQLVDAGAAAIVATTVEEETLERLGWDQVFWPPARAIQPPVPPVTLLALSFAPAPPPDLWEVLRPLAGRPASALGAEPGSPTELLIDPGESAPRLPVLQSEAEGSARLALGARVRVVAGRAEGLTGEVVALSPGPYRLRSEISAEVAEVAFPYSVRLRLPVLHLQVLPSPAG
jgi:hypothetical protein